MTFKRFAGLALVVGLVFMAVFPILWRALVQGYYEPRIFGIAAVPERPVAIVFGAAVFRGGRLSTVLRDRMETAIQLYENGQVERILVSGDTRSSGYSEPVAMADYAIQRGVPAEAIELDHGGQRTYDSCYRAGHEFGVKKAILVTQAFHLPRALFTCDRLGISAVGVAADQRPYRGARWYAVRETAATLVALWDTVRQQQPAILGIPVSNNDILEYPPPFYQV